MTSRGMRKIGATAGGGASEPSSRLRWLGVDENGLGPCMGPLCVTLVEGQLASLASAAPVTALGKQLKLTDSKVICGHGRMRWAESVALALLQRVWGTLPDDLAELDRRFRASTWALQPNGLATQAQRPCPSLKQAQLCWMERVPLPAFGGDPALAVSALDALADAGFTLTCVQQQALCVAEVNALAAGGYGRFAATLLAVEALLAERLDAEDPAAQLPVVAHCGLIGGIRDYPKHATSHLKERLKHATKDSDGVGYSVAPHHTVYFGRSQDERSLTTALASVVGKYTRELWMQAINQTLMRRACTTRPVSGYQDIYSKQAAAAALRQVTPAAPPTHAPTNPPRTPPAMCIVRGHASSARASEPCALPPGVSRGT